MITNEIGLGLKYSRNGRTIVGYDKNLYGKLLIPDGVEEIADNAFNGCDSITSVSFPKSLISIGYDAFADCSLEKVMFSNEIKQIDGFRNCCKLSEIFLPDSVDVIADYAFEGCTSLKKVTFPGELKKIGIGVFKNCIELEDVCLPIWLDKIDDYAFQGCKSIAEFFVPDDVTIIGNHAFEGCLKLQDLELPNNLRCIGDRAFGCCCDLETIIIPQSVITIGNGVIDGCTSLKNLTFMGAVETIGESNEWLIDGVYNSEVDDYLYGYNIDTEPFDFQDKVIYEKETSNAWLERLKRFNINVRSGDESLYSELLSYYKNNIRPYQPLKIEGKITIKSLNERYPRFREIKPSYFDFSDDDASLNPDLW